MFKIANAEQFYGEISAIDERLSTIRLHKIKINKENLTIRYEFISDKTIDNDLKERVMDYLFRITADSFKKIEIEVYKVVADSELIVNEIFNHVQNNYRSVSIWFDKSDITVKELGAKVKYSIALASDAKEYFESNKILNILNEHLSGCFCCGFEGSLTLKDMGKEFEEDASLIYEEMSESFKQRTFEVSDVVGIDDKTPPTKATYISDVREPGNYVFAGTVSSIKEKLTKKGKPFFIIDFDDTTAKITGLCFSKDETVEKIREITVGTDIIVRGKMSYYGDKGLSLTIDKISLCKFPENFVKEELPLKNPPRVYRKVKPVPAELITVKNIFDKELVLGDDVLGKTLVCVDIETTGKNALSDAITEIGAVKIVDGKITEEWGTLINPKVQIPQDIVALTGITDEMVADKPEIAEIFGDFLYFCIDADVLVGQNIVEFDAKFLERTARDLHYKFEKTYKDTLLMARRLLPHMHKFGLKFLAEEFNIELVHHRAVNDAKATAQVFLELENIEQLNKNK